MKNIKSTIKFTGGFTLVELIVMVGIMGLLGIVFTDILTQTLRGQSKVKVVNQVKQNGQVVLGKLVSEIQQAEKIVCVDSPLNDASTNTIVVFRQGKYLRFRFVPPLPGQNGYIVWDTFTNAYNSEVSLGEYCTRSLFSGQNYLSDIDSLNGVSLDYPSVGAGRPYVFKKDVKDGYNEVVTIQFRAFPGTGGGKTYESSLGEEGVFFKTSVQVRAIR